MPWMLSTLDVVQSQKTQPLTADYPSTGHATSHGHRQMGEQKEGMSQYWSVCRKSWHMKSHI